MDVVPAAFIHFGFAHVAANTVPLLVLGLPRGPRRDTPVRRASCALIIVADGLGVWLIAPADTNTAGASGLIFGLFGYPAGHAASSSGARWVSLVGLLVGRGLGRLDPAGLRCPTQSGVSWQGHLLGPASAAWLGGGASLVPRAP